MAKQFAIPATPPKSALIIDTFMGVDYTNQPSNVDERRSPWAPNMIRDVPGKVRKCMGWESFGALPERINGMHMLTGKGSIVHAGTSLYWDLTRYAEAKSLSVLAGKNMLRAINNYGATEQSGTGDPSPTNIRPISGVGQFDKKVVLTGAESWWVAGDASRFVAALTMNGMDKKPCVCDVYKDVADVRWGNATGITCNASKGYMYVCDGVSVNLEEFKAKLSAHPITVYYQSTSYATATQFYTGLSITDANGYHGIGMDLGNQKLYGDHATGVYDTFESCVMVDGVLRSRRTQRWECLVLDGTESWYAYASGASYVGFFSPLLDTVYTRPAGYCTHYQVKTTIAVANNIVWIGVSNNRLYIVNVEQTTVDAFKSYLAAQKSAGTPVTIVRQLATPIVTLGDPYTIPNAEGTVVLAPTGGTISAVVHGVGNNDGIPEYEKIYTGCADARSSSWQYGNKLYLVDGKALLVYDGDKVAPASENAKIPIVTIGKAPSGGGKPLDDLNLLQPKFTEQFLGTETDKVYQLSFPGLDATAVTVKLLQANGTWVDKKEGTDFTVNRTTGAVTFLQAPGKSPVTGQDNISITASRTISGYADRINHCDIGILYGISGAADRLFLSGNPDNKNYDWFSEQYDFSYFPDTGYAVLGTDHSAIMGYSIINDRLAAHKDDMEDGRNVILRSGQLTDGKPAFPIVGTLQGPGAVAKHTCDYLCTEPLFLTGLGIYAITPADLTGERYANLRSYYINGLLLKEPHLEDAVGISYKDMYWLVLNGTGYILDGLQPQQTDKSAPYATRQYACFHRQGLPARVLWQREGRLWFGTNEGKICRFYNDPDALHSYSDDGQPITCSWRTPYLEGKSFYKNKSFKFLAIRLSSAVATSVKIFSQRRGIWTMIKENQAAARYFSWSNICWSKFSWSPDSTPKTVSGKVRVKKVDKACFEFQNTALNEPFGLMDYALEFVENGKYKG